MKKYFISIVIVILSINSFSQDYILKIAGQPPGEIDYFLSKQADSITVEGPYNPRIMRFRIFYLHLGFEQYMYSYSSKFTKAQKLDIQKFEYGQTITIDKIRIRTDSSIIDLPDITYTFSRYEGYNLCMIAGQRGGKINKDSILNNPYVRLYNSTDSIISYSFHYKSPGDNEILCTRSKIPNVVLRWVKKNNKGRKFAIENIIIQRADSTRFEIYPQMFILE